MTLSRPQHVINDRPVLQMSIYLVTGGKITTDYDGLILNHEPGDIVAIDYSLPYESRTPGFEGIAITFDKSSAPAGLRGHVHGAVLTANSSAGAVLGSQIRSLVDHINGLSVEQAQSAVDGILRFAETTFPESATRMKRDSVHLFQLATQTARRKLSDPDFGPEELASALSISRSKLFRLFEAHGGVQRWLLAERLSASLHCIALSSGRQKISAIARDHGFRSEAHFSRAFQKRYQVSPSSVVNLTKGMKGANHYLDWPKEKGATIEAWLASARSEAGS